MRLCLIGGVIILLVIIIGIPPDFMDLCMLTGMQSPLWSRRRRRQIWFRSFRGFLCHCMQSVLVICFFVWRGVGGVIGSNQYYYGE
jgi:hypothetical protein